MWSGYVYRIRCNIKNEDYYGSTEMTMEERIENHIKSVTSERGHKCVSSQIIERDDWDYEIMEEVDYIIKVDLLIRERYYIENYPCININIPYRTKEEIREYKKSHKRQYRIDNPDYVIRQKEHEWFNIKNECPCGGKYTNVHKSQHFRTKKHQRYINDN